MLVEDHELPLVRGTLLMRGGQRAAPPGKLGVATISAGVQRAGGSVAHPETHLDEALEQMAAFIEGGAGGEAISMGFGCLAEDVPTVMGLFSEVITTPALPQAKLELYQAQLLDLLKHRNDKVGIIPPRELAQLIYGKDSVFARNATPEQVAALQVGDLRDFLQTWERPDTSVLGVCGDFDSSQMRALIERHLGSWQVAPGQPAVPPLVPFTPLPPQGGHAGQVFLVDRPGLTQAAVALAEVGISIADPDSYALDVLGDVLNSFGGRLFDQVRSREGLAYSVSGGWSSTPVDHEGLFMASGETAAPAQFLAAVQRVLQETTQVPPTDREVESAKAKIVNSFVFNFASTSAQLSRMLTYSILGVPQDYLYQYKAGVEAVTPADILAAAQRHLHPGGQAAVIVGDAASLRPQLEAQGRSVWPLQLQEF